MPRTCTVCTNPKRSEIDGALVRSNSLRNIAKQFGTSAAALHRHKNSCVSEQLAKAKDISDVAAASSLIKELREITQKTGAILARAVREKDGDLALKAIARLERQLELKGRLLGQLEERGNGGKTIVQVVYLDSGTPKSPHSLSAAKVIDMKTEDDSTCNPLLDDQNREPKETKA